jgi:hypothetical protein
MVVLGIAVFVGLSLITAVCIYAVGIGGTSAAHGDHGHGDHGHGGHGH